MQMKPYEYAVKARQLAIDVNSSLWAQAEHAAMGKRDGIENWLEIMVAESGRAESTIYEWVKVVEFKDSLLEFRLTQRYNRLTFSHWTALCHASERGLSAETVLKLLHHVDDTKPRVTVEALRIMIADEFKDPNLPESIRIRKSIIGMSAKLSSMMLEPSLPQDWREHIEAAQRELAPIVAAELVESGCPDSIDERIDE